MNNNNKLLTKDFWRRRLQTNFSKYLVQQVQDLLPLSNHRCRMKCLPPVWNKYNSSSSKNQFKSQISQCRLSSLSSRIKMTIIIKEMMMNCSIFNKTNCLKMWIQIPLSMMIHHQGNPMLTFKCQPLTFKLNKIRHHQTMPKTADLIRLHQQHKKAMLSNKTEEIRLKEIIAQVVEIINEEDRSQMSHSY